MSVGADQGIPGEGVSGELCAVDLQCTASGRVPGWVLHGLRLRIQELDATSHSIGALECHMYM